MSTAEELAAIERRRNVLERRERIRALEEPTLEEELEQLTRAELEAALAFAQRFGLPSVAVAAIEAELLRTD
jgi:hypothetical protein